MANQNKHKYATQTYTNVFVHQIMFHVTDSISILQSTSTVQMYIWAQCITNRSKNIINSYIFMESVDSKFSFFLSGVG